MSSFLYSSHWADQSHIEQILLLLFFFFTVKKSKKTSTRRSTRKDRSSYGPDAAAADPQIEWKLKGKIPSHPYDECQEESDQHAGV